MNENMIGAMAKRATATPTSDANPPGDLQLGKLLGAAHAAFQVLAPGTAGTTREWKHYSKRSPWVLKVSRGTRTLYYLEPTAGAFKVTVVLGERATQAALAGRVSKTLHASIRDARAYPEGRPVRVIVRDTADLAGVNELLAVKLKPDAEPARRTRRSRGED